MLKFYATISCLFFLACSKTKCNLLEIFYEKKKIYAINLQHFDMDRQTCLTEDIFSNYPIVFKYFGKFNCADIRLWE